MTMLPQKGFNPWQQALYGLSSGLMAAGSPGGWSNFGMGVGQGISQFQDNQSRLVREQLLQKQIEREDRDYEAQQAKTAAEQKRLDLLRTQGAGLLATYDDQDPTNDAFGQRTPGELSLARLQLESNPDGLLEQFGDWTQPIETKTTDDQREYDLAKSQGFQGSFLDYLTTVKKAGAPSNSTTIYNKDYGAIPPGYRLVETPQGVQMEVVPNSPADTANKTKDQNRSVASDVVTTDINRVLGQMDNATLPTTGMFGGMLSGVPGTAAHNVSELVSGIQANASIDKLQQMRESSPTGGALGNVTERENKMLSDAIGSLEQSQTDDQFRYNLKRVHNLYLDIVHGQGGGPARYTLEKPAGPEGKSVEGWEDMGDGVSIREKP